MIALHARSVSGARRVRRGEGGNYVHRLRAVEAVVDLSTTRRVTRRREVAHCRCRKGSATEVREDMKSERGSGWFGRSRNGPAANPALAQPRFVASPL